MESPRQPENDPALLLQCLRLLIPPLRLVSAATWHIVHSSSVHHYGVVEEFVTTVTEILPELLSADHKFQLLLGLRARMVLELCHSEVESVFIRKSLEHFKSLVSTWAAQPCSVDIQVPVSNFVDAVELFLKDPEDKKSFQDFFPQGFGPDYDDTLQTLMLDFLSRLDELLPVPDIQQTASMLSSIPSALEECARSVPDPHHLTTVLQHLRTFGQSDLSCEDNTSPSSTRRPILCTLSLPHLQKEAIPPNNTRLQSPSEHLMDCSQVEMEEGIAHSGVGLQEDDSSGGVVLQDLKGESKAAGDALNPSTFQPLKERRSLRLTRRVKKKETLRVKGIRSKSSDSKTCPVCDKTFLREWNMRRHEMIHFAKQDYKYKCDSCHKMFRDQFDLNRHTIRIHENGQDGLGDKNKNEPVKNDKNCPQCGRCFAWGDDLERHMKSHSDECPYRCNFCDKKFKSHYALNKHERMVCKKREEKEKEKAASERAEEGHVSQEDKEKPSSPSDPALALLPSASNSAPPPDLSTSNLTSPMQPSTADSTPLMQPHPSNVKGVICPICSMILKNTRDLKKHLRCHSEEKPYVCITCEKGFKYKDTLKKHQVLKGHEGIREVQCKKLEWMLAEVAQNLVSVDRDDASNQEALMEPSKNSLSTPPFSSSTKKGLKVCPICSKTFDLIKHLNKHLMCHRVDRPYVCVHCKKRFKEMTSLKRHQIYAVCHNKGPRYSSKQGPHQGEVSSDDPKQEVSLHVLVWCSNCGSHFESLSALKEHQETVCKVEQNPVKTCKDCGKEFNCVSRLKVHQKTHNPLYCKECKKVLGDEAAFERHKLLHKPMRCTMCEETFTVMRRLREHYEKQHDFKGPYPCPRCEKTFTVLSYLVIHQRVHNGEFPFVCDKCPMKFRTSNNLTVHMRRHTGEKPFLCWQCGKRYRSCSELKIHMVSHSDERPWACPQCRVAFRTKMQLKSHVEQIHMGIRHSCTVCGKAFMKEMSLKRHLLIHTGERPFACKHCNKTFLSGNELLRHSRYHTGERPYSCNECGKAFIQSSFLTVHMRLHTGEKPYKCNVCDKRFRLSCHMKKHVRTHERNQNTYVCGVCGLTFAQKKAAIEHSVTHQESNETELEIQS